MAVQNGRDLLIKMDMAGDGTFQTIAGLRATRLGFNAQSVDVTSLESQGGWRELLAGAGVRSASISGSGSSFAAISAETTSGTGSRMTRSGTRSTASGSILGQHRMPNSASRSCIMAAICDWRPSWTTTSTAGYFS